MYYSYLKNKISRNDLWNTIPEELFESIINDEISVESIGKIFSKIDRQLNSIKVDVIIGGPPCQAYSLVGRSRDPNRMKGDKRNFLFRYYAQFLIRYTPKYFVFENVLGLLTAGNANYLKEMLNLFSESGYSTDMQVLNAEEYGVLQKRKRVIIIGRKGKTKFQFPKLEKIENIWQIKRDLFFDLPFLKPGQEIPVAHYTKNNSKYLKITEIRNGIDFTTQHITRNHNERDLEIYSIAIDKWLHDKQRLKYNDIPKRLQTHKNTVSDIVDFSNDVFNMSSVSVEYIFNFYKHLENNFALILFEF